MRSPILKLILPVLLLLSGAVALQAQTVPVRRLGLFIGCNQGDNTRPNLLYATTDAQNMASLMGDIGGIEHEDMTILLNPNQKAINNAFREMKQQIGMYREVTGRIEVVFYYSGHSDDIGLLIGQEVIRYPELRTMLKEMGADVTIAIIDSCSSGAITRLKGGKRVSPFMIDDSAKMEGHAYLTSSSATEASQESDTIRGSFFTYFLMTGLRGAADVSGDGRVTLNELYQHTYQETLYRTERTMGGPQHPSYEIQLTGTGDLVMTDITKPSSSVVIGPDIGGRLFVRNERGQLVAELEKIPGIPLVLALEAGTYSLTVKSTDSQTLFTSISLESGDRKTLTLMDLTASGIEMTRLRGEGDKDQNGEGDDGGETGDGIAPFSFSFWPGATFPRRAQDGPVHMTLGVCAISGPVSGGGQLSLIGNKAQGEVRGVQVSSIYNIADGPLWGGQITSVINRAGGLNGIQVSGLINVLEAEGKGAQLAGIGNTALQLRGFQGAGIYNTGEIFNGVQAAGLFNIATEVRGGQLAGLFNVTGQVNGVQLAGLFNYSEKANGILIAPVNIAWQMDAVPIGLINISRNGIIDPALWYDTNNTLWASFRSGNERVFTLLAVGYNANSLKEGTDDNTTDVYLNIGFGSRIRFTEHFYLDWVAGMKIEMEYQEKMFYADHYWTYNDDTEEVNLYGIPNLQLMAGWELNRFFAVEGGICVDIRTPLHNDNTFEDYNYGYVFDRNGTTEEAWGIYPSAFIGVRF